MITELGEIVVNLMDSLNKCRVISPRFDVKLKDLKNMADCPSGFTLTTSAGIKRSKTKTKERKF